MKKDFNSGVFTGVFISGALVALAVASGALVVPPKRDKYGHLVRPPQDRVRTQRTLAQGKPPGMSAAAWSVARRGMANG